MSITQHSMSIQITLSIKSIKWSFFSKASTNKYNLPGRKKAAIWLSFKEKLNQFQATVRTLPLLFSSLSLHIFYFVTFCPTRLMPAFDLGKSNIRIT